MKIYLIAFLTLFTLFTGLVAKGTCGMTEFRKRIIKHRANVGGDCEERDNCIGIIGDKVYNYQEINRHGEQLSLKEVDDVVKGKLTIDRDGLEIDEATRENFGLKENDIKDVRNVYQYLEIKRDISGSRDGHELDVGHIENKNNRKIRNIENIVRVKGGVKGVRNGNLGQVSLKKSRTRQISNSTMVDRGVGLSSGQVLSIGGVIIDSGTVTDGIESSVFIKGR